MACRACAYIDVTEEFDELQSENRTRNAADIVTDVYDKSETTNATLAPGDVIELTDLMTVAQTEHMADLAAANTTEEQREIAEV